MCRRLSIVCAGVIAVAAVLAAAGSAGRPLQARLREARTVEAQTVALDRRLEQVVEAWNGARLQLTQIEQQLTRNRVALVEARGQNRTAQRRLARRLVVIYESDRPDLLQLLAGASNVSDLINLLEYGRDVARADQQLAQDAQQARQRLIMARHALRTAERRQRVTLTGLSTERRRISALLSDRRQLLSTIRARIRTLRAREAAVQRRLAAAARARLARETRLRAAARRRAETSGQTSSTAHSHTRAAQGRTHVVPDDTSGASNSPPPHAAAPVDETTTTSSTSSTSTAPTDPPNAETTSAPAPPPPASAPPASATGHPEAATIALRYLGVRYQWGGASPGSGFDCSGLVEFVYAQLGIQLPHFAAAQYRLGVPVSRGRLQAGDLVFFDSLNHVGIYIGDDQFVHAPHTGDVVKISSLSDYAGSYVGARRL